MGFLRKRIRAFGGPANLFLTSILVVSALASTVSLLAQSTAQESRGASDLTGGKEEDRVSVNLVLHDKKGKPVQDLKPGDFSVTDSGRKINASELSLSNGAATGDHVVTFLFGRLDSAGSKNAARAARMMLKDLGDSPSAIGVWAIDSRLSIVQSYTPNRSLVEAAITTATAATGKHASVPGATTTVSEKALAVNPDDSADSRSSKQKNWDRASLEALNDAAQLVEERHAPWSIATLYAAGQSLRSLSGRKAVIYFTQEVPTSLDAADMLRTTARKLRDSGTSVYVVDLNALDENAAQGMQAALVMGGMAASNHLNPTPVLSGAASGLQPLTTPSEMTQIRDTINQIEIEGTTPGKNMLAQLADATGGAYTEPDANMKKVCRQLSTDLTNYYTLSFPEAGRLDGSFHAVLVKPLRPGIKLRSQPGYFAMPGVNETGGEHQAMLEERSNEGSGEMERLSDSASSSDLVFRSAVLRFGESAAGIHSVVAVQVPIDQIDLRNDPNTDLFSLHVSVAAVIKNAAGVPVAHFAEEFRRHGAINAADKLRSQSLSMERATHLPAGDYTLDAVVRDWNTDKIGKTTQTIHLVSSADAGDLSDIVLVGSTEKSESMLSPLKYGDDRVVPNLSGDVSSKTGEAALYFQLYADAKAAKDAEPEKLRLEISRNGSVLATLPLQVHEMKANEVSSRVARVKLGNGSYDLALVLDRGGKVVRRQLSVTSEGSDEAASGKADDDKAGANFVPAGLDLDTKPSTTPPPTAVETEALISGAREHALNYTHLLPNFLCVESIDRSIDHKGTGVWKRHDSIVEMLRYHEKLETRTVLEVNGEKSKMQADHIEGAHSNGEFGGILQAIFDPAAAASFAWQKAEQQNGETVQVFSYKVQAKDSQFLLSDSSGWEVKAGIHGYVFIDGDTQAVRRLIAQTDGLPENFGIKASWMAIDYNYIGINGHDYLLPTRGEVGLKQGRHEEVLNQLRFDNYRRFGSKVRVLSGPVGAAPQP